MILIIRRILIFLSDVYIFMAELVLSRIHIPNAFSLLAFL